MPMLMETVNQLNYFKGAINPKVSYILYTD